jgi:hypothetical protein
MSKSIVTEIIINAPKERVWQVLTNFKAYGTWNPFIKSIEGELRVGARLTNTMWNAGKAFVFKPLVLTVRPNAYFDWLGSLWFKGIFDGHHYFEIEQLSAGQVKLTQGENFSGLLSGPILKKIGADTRNNFIKMNNALKLLAEQ